MNPQLRILDPSVSPGEAGHSGRILDRTKPNPGFSGGSIPGRRHDHQSGLALPRHGGLIGGFAGDATHGDGIHRGSGGCLNGEAIAENGLF
ncbi:MAG TPA: hypothetical protein VMS21_11770 [Methylomirabilota bacterium]|nr:hypothetical protein [Methylomirabilota bacterium]